MTLTPQINVLTAELRPLNASALDTVLNEILEQTEMLLVSQNTYHSGALSTRVVFPKNSTVMASVQNFGDVVLGTDAGTEATVGLGILSATLSYRGIKGDGYDDGMLLIVTAASMLRLKLGEALENEWVRRAMTVTQGVVV